MSRSIDWLSHTRTGQLLMARTWISVFTENTTDSKGATVKKYLAWGIPADTFTELGTLYGTAQEALTAAQEKETRTAVTNAACKTAFDALVAAMRNPKKRFLYVPPLTEADLVSLGLNIHFCKECRMDIKEVLGKVNGVIGKLPFVKLAGNIPEGARAKIPFLNALIPFANHIASGAAIVVLVAALGGGGGGGGSGGLAGTNWQVYEPISGTNVVMTFGQTEFKIMSDPDTVSLSDIRGGTLVQQGTYKVTGNQVTLIYQDGTESAPMTIGELTLTAQNGVFQKVQ